MRLFARAGRQTYQQSRSTPSSSCPPTTTPAWIAPQRLVAVQYGTPRRQPDHAPGHGPNPLRPTTGALAQGGAPRRAGCLKQQAGVIRIVFDGGLFVPEPSLGQPPRHPGSDLFDQALNVLGRRRRHPDEAHPPEGLVPDEDPVGQERVEVYVEVQRATEALDDRDRAASRASDTQRVSCPSSVPSKDGPQEDLEHTAAQVVA
jgi:hypothetical protein